MPAVRTVMLAAGALTALVPQASSIRHSCWGRLGDSTTGGSAAARQRAHSMAAAPPGRTVVVLFRNDLRLHDSPVLQAAVEEATGPITEGQVEVRENFSRDQLVAGMPPRELLPASFHQ